MAINKNYTIDEIVINTASWTEVDMDTLSKANARSIAILLSDHKIAVACENGAPCTHTAARLIVKLL